MFSSSLYHSKNKRIYILNDMLHKGLRLVWVRLPSCPLLLVLSPFLYIVHLFYPQEVNLSPLFKILCDPELFMQTKHAFQLCECCKMKCNLSASFQRWI